MAFQHAAFGDFQVHPFALYGVGVFNRDLRVLQRIADLLGTAPRLMVGGGRSGYGVFVEHGDILFMFVFSLSQWERMK
ncbi:hypothetical protein KIF59_12030 [Enterobacter cloacae subsp. cloacae]|nr:hypothetical protein [Enterobacter cloacae subsp. cloacae]